MAKLAYTYKLSTSELREPLSIPGGTTNKIQRKLIEKLQDHSMTILIDEVDYAFSNKTLLGAIRDIVDETYSEVILIGMANAKDRLLKANAHYFDRCNYFAEFKPLKPEEVRMVVSDVCEVQLEDALVDRLHKVTSGTLRGLIQEINTIEVIARANHLQTVTLAMWLAGREKK